MHNFTELNQRLNNLNIKIKSFSSKSDKLIFNTYQEAKDYQYRKWKGHGVIKDAYTGSTIESCRCPKRVHEAMGSVPLYVKDLSTVPHIDKEDEDRFLLYFSKPDWSGDVEPKWTPPEGLFESGTAEEIAKAEHDGHDSLKSAMASINFYLNRGGDNIPEDRRRVIESSKDILRGMYE